MQEPNSIAQKLPAAIAVTIVTLLEAMTVPRAAVAADAARPPNVLFVLSDDQRPDTIHALGNPIIETPHLDRLVRDGTVFTRAVSPNPICVSSRAEILT